MNSCNKKYGILTKQPFATNIIWFNKLTHWVVVFVKENNNNCKLQNINHEIILRLTFRITKNICINMNNHIHTHKIHCLPICLQSFIQITVKIPVSSQKKKNPVFFYNHPIYRGTMGLHYTPHIDNGWDTKSMLQLPFPDWDMDMSTMMWFTLQNFSYKINSSGAPWRFRFRVHECLPTLEVFEYGICSK
jgi:hypothetical protein